MYIVHVWWTVVGFASFTQISVQEWSMCLMLKFQCLQLKNNTWFWSSVEIYNFALSETYLLYNKKQIIMWQE